jgi:hypothetical protein
MAPFRKKGWVYYKKLQDIMPNASARGNHAFSAMHVAPPNALDQSVDVDEPEILGVSEVNHPLVSGSGAAADTSSINDNIKDSSITDGSLMDIDNDNKSSTAVSASSGKRKLSTSTPLGAFSFAEPAMKKSTTSTYIGSSQSFPKTSSGPPSSAAPSSSKAQSSSKAGRPSCRVPSSSKHTSSKISPMLLVHEMQGTISSLARAV